MLDCTAAGIGRAAPLARQDFQRDAEASGGRAGELGIAVKAENIDGAAEHFGGLHFAQGEIERLRCRLTAAAIEAEGDGGEPGFRLPAVLDKGKGCTG